MILNVPYQSQIPFEDNGGARKWCGIASLWMVLKYYLKDHAPKVEELLDNYGPMFAANGFQHQDLIQIARDFGLRGFRKSWWAWPGDQTLKEKFKKEGESKEEIAAWEDTNIEESLYTLEVLINKKIPVILSVSPDFSPSTYSHLVILLGVENNHLIIHDPYKKGANFKISREDFKKFWLKQAIIVYHTYHTPGV